MVYAKLPHGFLIPTPVGDYNLDWAISFTAGSVQHIYFEIETKRIMSSTKSRVLEQTKIACAHKFFDEIGQCIPDAKVKCELVTVYA